MADPTPAPTPAPTFPPTPAPGVNPQSLAVAQQSANALTALADGIDTLDMLNPARVRWSLVERLIGAVVLPEGQTLTQEQARAAFDQSGNVLRWLQADYPTWFAPTPTAAPKPGP